VCHIAALLQAFALLTVPVGRAEPAEDAIRTKIDRLLAGVAAGDLDRAMADWPAAAPGRATCLESLKNLVPPKKFSMKVEDVKLYHWKVEKDRASLRLRFTCVGSGPMARELFRRKVFYDIRFANTIDGWSWDGWELSIDAAARSIARAASRAEALRLLEQNEELPVRTFTFALTGQFVQALETNGDKATAKLLQESLGELARMSKDPTAEAYAAFALGRVLREEGRPDLAAPALERAQKKFIELALERPTAVDTHYLMESNDRLVEALLAAGRSNDALSQGTMGLEIARATKDAGYTIRAAFNLGVVLRTMGSYVRAAEKYRLSATLAHDEKSMSLECRALLGLGEAENLAGNTPDAVKVLTAALKLAEKLESDKYQSSAHSLLACCAREEGKYREAIAGLEKAIILGTRCKDRAGVLTSEMEMGNTLLLQGETDQAIAHYRKAYDLAKQDGAVPHMTAALANIASALQDQGKMAEAFRALHTAFDAATVAKDYSVLPSIHHTFGHLYSRTGQPLLAYDHYLLSYRIAEKTGDRRQEVQGILALATVSAEIGMLTEARAMASRVQELARQSQLFESDVIATNMLAQIEFHDGKKEPAIARMREAIDRIVLAGNPSLERRHRARLGRMLLRMNRLEEAGAEFARALSSAEPAADTDTIRIVRTGMGNLAMARGKWEEAVPHFQAAIAIIEKYRQDTREPGLQTGLFGTLTEPYLHLVACWVELGQPDKAFREAERVKGRTLGEILQNHRGILARGLTPAERTREQELIRAITERTNALVAISSRKPGPAAVAEAKDRLEAAHADLQTFRDKVYLDHPGLQTARAEFEPASLRELEPLFRDRPGLVVLSYLVCEDRTLIFVLEKGDEPGKPVRLTVQSVQVDKFTLMEEVDEFREGCSSDGASVDSRNLVRRLIDPIAPVIASARELLIVPDGHLHQLPFHALRLPDRKYLIERCPVSYGPSVTALLKMKELAALKKKQRAGPPMLAVGISYFGDAANPLPQAEPEARNVERIFPRTAPGPDVTLLLNASATKQKVLKAWADRRCLHFATHAAFNKTAPLFSYIMLSTDGKDEGRLYARELFDVELAAELVVLSACETGVGKVVSGEGQLGMSWSWFVAGVPSLVVSQWMVADMSTAELMKEFYSRLLAGDSKAVALQKAQIALLEKKKTRHPFYWAPFVLVGYSGD
jgi:CHAT domain-containing protein/tetratricopeptide (TPR) repeat protein